MQRGPVCGCLKIFFVIFLIIVVTLSINLYIIISQPGGARITVEGLDLDGLDLEQAPEGSELATTRWSSEPVTLTGSMVSGVLTGAELG